MSLKPVLPRFSMEPPGCCKYQSATQLQVCAAASSAVCTLTCRQYSGGMPGCCRPVGSATMQRRRALHYTRFPVVCACLKGPEAGFATWDSPLACAGPHGARVHGAVAVRGRGRLLHQAAAQQRDLAPHPHVQPRPDGCGLWSGSTTFLAAVLAQYLPSTIACPRSILACSHQIWHMIWHMYVQRAAVCDQERSAFFMICSSMNGPSTFDSLKSSSVGRATPCPCTMPLQASEKPRKLLKAFREDVSCPANRPAGYMHAQSLPVCT